MKPQLSQDEEHALLRKLVYVKWLWLRGAQDAERNDELSHMSAILAFHNAIEMVIQNIIITHKYAQSASLKNTKFAGLIEMIESRGTKSCDYPLADKQLLIKLAEQRNGIMHHGQQFHKNEVTEARSLSLRFIGNAIREFFEYELDSISMRLLIKSDQVKQWLESAEESSAAGNYQDAIIYASAVIALAEKVVNAAYGGQKTEVSPFGNFRLNDHGYIPYNHFSLSHPYHSLSKEIENFVKSSNESLRKKINESLKDLGDALHKTERSLNLQMKELTGTSWLLICNADLEKARKFFDLGITVKFPETYWGITDVEVYQKSSAPKEYTKESVQVSIEFAIDLALKLQALGLSDNFYVNAPIFQQRKQQQLGWPPKSLDLPPLLLEIQKKADEDKKELQNLRKSR